MSDPTIFTNSSLPNRYGPITAGQLFERTFTLLRENFKLFFGIVLILVGVEIVFGGMSAGFLGGNALLTGRSVVGPASIGRILFLAPIMFVGGVLLFILIQIIQGALFIATRAKLAATEITVGEACSLAAERAGRLIGISLLILVRAIGYVLLFGIAFAIVAGAIGVFGGLTQALAGGNFSRGHLPSAGVIAALLLLFVVGGIAYLLFWLWLASRYALSIPAALAENLPVTDAIRRSIHLSKGSRGRLYSLFVAIVVADIAIAAVTVPFQLVLGHGTLQHGAALGAIGVLLAGFRILTSAFIVAVMGVATALCYFDLRVRKDGFGVVTPPTPAVPIAPAEAWPLPPTEPTGELPTP